MRRPLSMLFAFTALLLIGAGDPVPPLEFGGFRWRLHAPVPVDAKRHLGNEWEYRSSETKARLIERRRLDADRLVESDYQKFASRPLIARYMEVQNPKSGEWIMHGLDMRYHDDGSVGYGVWWMGEVSRQLDVRVPPPDFLWDAAWQEPAP